MPTVFRQNGIRFFFYSNEGHPREPRHIHAIKDQNEAKVFLEPGISVAWSSGFNGKELRAIVLIVKENQSLIERAWHDHFGN